MTLPWAARAVMGLGLKGQRMAWVRLRRLRALLALEVHLPRRSAGPQLLVLAGGGGEVEARGEVGVRPHRMGLPRGMVMACSRRGSRLLVERGVGILPRQAEEREGAGGAEVGVEGEGPRG
jgi:hypothetical protein